MSEKHRLREMVSAVMTKVSSSPPEYTECGDPKAYMIKRFNKALEVMVTKGQEPPLHEKAALLQVLAADQSSSVQREFYYYSLGDPESFYELIRGRCPTLIKRREELYYQRCHEWARKS